MKTARLFSALFLFTALLVQLVVRIEVTQKTYSIEKVRQNALQNDMELRDLKLNYAWLTSPGQIARRASETLGMVSTDPGDVVTIQR